MLEIGLLGEVRSVVVPVRLVVPVVVWIIPVWLIVPWWLVWRLIPHVSAAVGVYWEVTEVSGCVPVLTNWALVFEGKTGVALVEAFAVGGVREMGGVAWILAAWATLIGDSDQAYTRLASSGTSIVVWNDAWGQDNTWWKDDAWWQDDAWRENDTWWKDWSWNGWGWVVARWWHWNSVIGLLRHLGTWWSSGNLGT